MDKTALVANEFAMGAKVLEALDRADLAIRVALWLHSPDYDDWRLVLSSRRLDGAPLDEAFGLVHDALEEDGIPLEQTPTLMIMRMTDPFIKALRQSLAKVKGVEGMRLGGQMLGDRFVHDARVLRVE